MARTTARSIEVMHDWVDGDGRAAFDALLEEFGRQHSEYSVTERTADSVRLSAKTGLLREDPPDVWIDWPGKNLGPYVEADVLRDLTPIWDENDLEGHYLEGAQSVARFDGQYFAIPTNIHRLNNLFYDVETVEEAGVDPSAIDSPREFLETLEQIEDATDEIPFIQPLKNPTPLLQLWATVLLGEFGVDTYRSVIEGNARANRGAIEDTLQIVRQYSEFMSEDALFLDLTSGPRRFVDSGAAFFSQGDWSVSVFDAAEDFEFRRDWEQAPFPGTDSQYMMNMDATLVAEMAGNRESIDAFLRTVSSVAGQKAFNRAKGSIPARMDVPDDEFSPFQRTQMQAFERSRDQPPSIAHGLAVGPNQLIELLMTFASFAESWNVDATTREVVDAFQG